MASLKREHPGETHLSRRQGRAFQTEGMASAKPRRQEQALHAGERQRSFVEAGVGYQRSEGCERRLWRQGPPPAFLLPSRPLGRSTFPVPLLSGWVDPVKSLSGAGLEGLWFLLCGEASWFYAPSQERPSPSPPCPSIKHRD